MLNNIVTPIGYTDLHSRKFTGSHYTPKDLSDFVATQMIQLWKPEREEITIADPAVGDGELLFSLTSILLEKFKKNIEVHGFDIDNAAIKTAEIRLKDLNNANIHLVHQDFIDYVLTQSENNLFEQHSPTLYDAVIANPPYIRTQVLGSKKAQTLSKKFNLNGRVDLYHAFILGIAKLLKPGGILGIIVSNRFMTTKSGENVRKNILELFDVLQIWDFGDTQMFEAAVLPAVLILKKKANADIKIDTCFTSIYSSNDGHAEVTADSILEAIKHVGIVRITNKGFYKIQQGSLDNGNSNKGVWTLSNGKVDDWLKTVESNSYLKFSDIGKIKVGVKTTADRVFIRTDWDLFQDEEKPELLRRLTTHHIARRFKPMEGDKWRWILYPHETVNGIRKVIELNRYPKTAKYLNQHKAALEKREYVIQAGRKWYEIWVPHDPDSWTKPKVVFRDISEKPTFWLDVEGTVVNGDCYWLTSEDNNMDLLWLALAVSNSSFIEIYYDRKFNNKLYSGRRRFISQYVEKFPLPDPRLNTSKLAVVLAKKIYNLIERDDVRELEEKLDKLIWTCFGLSNKEIPR